MSEWIDAEQRVERAQEMYRSGRWEDALRELRCALEINPHRGEWHFNVGLTLEAMGRHEEALRAYRKALDMHGEDAEILMQIGLACLRLGRPREAVHTLDRAATLDRDDAEPRAYQVEAYRLLKDHENAETAFYLACQLDEEHAPTYKHMARSLLDRGMVDAAISCLQKLRRIAPHDMHLNAHLGQAYWMRGELDRARRAFGRQVRRSPRDVQSMLDLGQVLSEMGLRHEAMEKFRRVVELEPMYAEAHFAMGCLSLAGGHLDTAGAGFEAALQLNPNYPLANQKLAAVAVRRGQMERARRHILTELDVRGPASLPLGGDQRELVGLMLDCGMHAVAVDFLHELIEDDEKDPELWRELSAALLMTGEIGEGVRAARRAVKLDKNCLSAMQNLVIAHVHRRELSRAAYWLRRALKLAPTDRRTRYLRSLVRWHAIKRWVARCVFPMG